MEATKFPWFRVAVLAGELALVAAAIIFPLVISAETLAGLLRILELVAKMH